VQVIIFVKNTEIVSFIDPYAVSCSDLLASWVLCQLEAASDRIVE